MLYLNPPYHVVDGVSLLPDHADPLQFYFLPLAPHLTLLDAGGQRIPQLQLIKYTGQQASGGFLNFDCDLGVEQDRLDAIAADLQGLAGLPGTPKLAPVPLVDGTVKMMLLGQESAPAEPPPPRPGGGPPVAEPAGPTFVTKISHHAKPSLYGDNRAAFSVALDPAGATLVEQALGGEMSPIGVVYSLTYVGLRPAYDVRVTADWDRVQRHLEESFSANAVFYSSDIDKVVDKLVEDRVIVIEGTLLVAEGEGGDGGVRGRYEQAMDEVREMVTETFFEPSLEPIESDRGGFTDTLRRTSQLLAQGGHGAPFSRREVDITRIDRKSLNVNMSERTAVLRSIHPQGHLAGIARVIRDEGLDLARFVLAVSLDDPFFARRTLRVIPRVEFETDAIASVNVSATYGGDTRNVVLVPGATEQALEWQSLLEAGAMRREAQVSYEVTFTSRQGTGRPAAVRSAPETVVGDAIEIAPRADGVYDVMPVTINAVDFPWALYPQVELDCEYADPARGIDVRDGYTLDAGHPGGVWPVFRLDRALRTIRYRTLLHGADGRDVQTDWVTTDEAEIRIADPFDDRRSLEIVAPSGLFASGLDRVFVDVWYDDPANGVSKRESFELNAQTTATQRFVVELVDPQRREVSFRMQMLRADGTVIEIPESTTTQDRIIVTEKLKGHRSVAVRLQPADFDRLGLREVLVEAQYTDPAAQLSFADNIRFSKPTDRGRFEFDFVDPAKDAYRYRVTHAYSSGMSKATDWLESDVAELVVPVQ